jgi:hypothetical protein
MCLPELWPAVSDSEGFEHAVAIVQPAVGGGDVITGFTVDEDHAPVVLKGFIGVWSGCTALSSVP